MHQTIKSVHLLDEKGNPSGGISTQGTGLRIDWQDGPLGRGTDRKPPNGAFVEDVIRAAIGRLKFYEEASGGRFSCEENRSALAHLAYALAALEERTARREAREVEGTHQP